MAKDLETEFPKQDEAFYLASCTEQSPIEIKPDPQGHAIKVPVCDRFDDDGEAIFFQVQNSQTFFGINYSWKLKESRWHRRTRQGV